jgi:hypothetical protein
MAGCGGMVHLGPEVAHGRGWAQRGYLQAYVILT